MPHRHLSRHAESGNNKDDHNTISTIPPTAPANASANKSSAAAVQNTLYNVWCCRCGRLLNLQNVHYVQTCLCMHKRCDCCRTTPLWRGVEGGVSERCEGIGGRTGRGVWIGIMRALEILEGGLGWEFGFGICVRWKLCKFKDGWQSGEGSVCLKIERVLEDTLGISCLNLPFPKLEQNKLIFFYPKSQWLCFSNPQSLESSCHSPLLLVNIPESPFY